MSERVQALHKMTSMGCYTLLNAASCSFYCWFKHFLLILQQVYTIERGLKHTGITKIIDVKVLHKHSTAAVKTHKSLLLENRKIIHYFTLCSFYDFLGSLQRSGDDLAHYQGSKLTFQATCPVSRSGKL